MNTSDLIKNIAKKDFDVHQFVQLAITDKNARNEIVNRMVTDPHIMVYYHCYYVIFKASLKKPGLFYKYWDQISKLMRHENSYHRNFALDIIGNLLKVDHKDRLAEIEDDYFALINDEKFMTGNCCLQNLHKIYRNKPGLRDNIVAILLDIDNACNYTVKQRALLKHDVLEIFEDIYDQREEKEGITGFIKAQIDSVSPKSRKKAKQLVQKFNIN